jgi:excisionase family DNA binding protein
MPEIQKLYCLDEAAPILGLTLGTLRQYVSTGVIPALYIGRKRVIQAAVLERICTEGMQTKAKAAAKVSA